MHHAAAGVGGEVVTDKNPLTDEQRKSIQDELRGIQIMPGVWRNFCCACGLPLAVTHEFVRFKSDLTCDDCRPSIQDGNKLSGAFSPEKRTR